MSETTQKMAARPSAPRAQRRRVAQGPARPHYLTGEDHDLVLMTLVNLLGEVSTLRDRLDTHEALAERGQVATREAVEAFRPDAAREAERRTERGATLKRVLRLVLADYEQRVTRRQEPDFSDLIRQPDA